MYVSLKNQELSVQLPDKVAQHKNALYNDLMNEFGFEPMNQETLKTINNYIINWFSEKGIEL